MLEYNDINKGDLVDFGAHGNLYVCNTNIGGVSFWATDREDERLNVDSSYGKYISKTFAERILNRVIET